MSSSLKLEDDHGCYVCGKNNPHGFRLDFSHPEEGVLKIEVVFRAEHQGYKNIVHGGMVAMLLDEMMVNLAWIEGAPSVTAELTTRLKKPVKVGERVFFEGRIDRRGARTIYASASATNIEGELLATAKATCVRIQRQ